MPIPPPARLFIAAALISLSPSCLSLSTLREPDTAVVYALGSVEGFPSPISSKLQPVCPALVFSGESFRLQGRHQVQLDALAQQLKETPKRLIAVGYAPPKLPEDYARGLSGRRAQAVRQYLIELGIEAAEIQTLGLGSDFSPSGPSSGVVVIYSSEEATPVPPTTPADSSPVESGTPVASR